MINYTFPIIHHIDDVLPHINGRQEFKVMRKDWYTVINYVVNFGETFDWDETDVLGSAMRRECRGLIFNAETGLLISRPLHKFFNVGERPEIPIDSVDLFTPHIILLKCDGSMVRPIPLPDKSGWRLGTKAGITDVAMNAEVWIANKPNYIKFVNDCITQNLTPIFEWVSRKNRIIIDYPEDDLILLAIRHNYIGEYLNYS